ncbi:class E basic helix-loop-helix protein 40 [Hippocampus zosterae]|uniref:class E basic helix-loop-helix protein 40 n=1 Tax=Hippocampus zosterae TaxID=109293 RepID=UPI00223E0067|nr:class E basic helix-loop-helix protein 40 [Hippocampus zosterae]
MEATRRAQPPPSLDIAEVTGMDFSLYAYKSRRGAKRGDDGRETYKLPHRLIEKKRRDRINECIGQLKDLLPEHLKLTTLGHLEKAVVLELTLKHVNALNGLLEQQRRKIAQLQRDLQTSDRGGGDDDDPEVGERMFRWGFHLCAEEVLRCLARREGGRDPMPSVVASHLRQVASEAPPPRQSRAPGQGPSNNCVPVIRRTCPGAPGEQSGSDTDTDSGYGGEPGKRRPEARRSEEAELERPAADDGEPLTKKSRAGPSEDRGLPAPAAGGPGGYAAFSPERRPLPLPLYLLPPAAAAYLPVPEKRWYPGGVPFVYPGAGASAADLAPESLSPPSLMSQGAGSPPVRRSGVDGASQRGSPANSESKD